MATLAANALTTLDTAKTFLGIALTDTSRDDEVCRLINASSDLFERLTCRTYYRDDAISERMPGYGEPWLIVRRTPLNSVTSIDFDTGAIDLANVTIDNVEGGLIGRPGGWHWTAHTEPSITLPLISGTEQLRYTVVYSGGYYTPQQELDNPLNVRTLPYDIEQAILALVKNIDVMNARDGTVKSEKLLSWSATYGSEVVTSQIATVVSLYRRPK